jgi:hypothetical protein
MEPDWFLDSEKSVMKSRFILFRRAGVFYSEDTVTRKQTSLRTKDEAEAVVLLNAKNESFRQPVLNVQIARAYLTAGDPAFAQRTWQSVMEQMQTHGKDSTKTRCARAMQSKAFDGLRRKKLMETSAEDFLAILNGGKVASISNWRTSSSVLCVPSICELSTASWRTYMETKRFGFGKMEVTPSSLPSA